MNYVSRDSSSLSEWKPLWESLTRIHIETAKNKDIYSEERDTFVWMCVYMLELAIQPTFETLDLSPLITTSLTTASLRHDRHHHELPMTQTSCERLALKREGSNLRTSWTQWKGSYERGLPVGLDSSIEVTKQVTRLPDRELSLWPFLRKGSILLWCKWRTIFNVCWTHTHIYFMERDWVTLFSWVGLWGSNVQFNLQFETASHAVSSSCRLLRRVVRMKYDCCTERESLV